MIDCINRLIALMDVSYGFIWPLTLKATPRILFSMMFTLPSFLPYQCVQWPSAGATILAGIPVAQVLGGCAGWSGSQRTVRLSRVVDSSHFASMKYPAFVPWVSGGGHLNWVTGILSLGGDR